ncbi:MAG TPA: FumA C-terminus/TtdB family hydratase beta subunit [Candidatus Thermoplasmatota archaeon]|nr:FumA C-terminus/TtdB family hydratase beta subunit [Candidatus Thermoplasmatota archaeon]
MEYRLHLPVRREEIKKLRIGDILYLSGPIFTARDAAHKLLLKKDADELPFNPSQMALYHCGPLMKQQNKKWTVVSAGPTTSSRMELFEDKVIEKFHVPIIIGKGGMGKKTADSLKRYTSVYTVYPGGVGVLAAENVTRVVRVYWLEELGMTEAIWILQMKNFGPLVVAMDSHGGSLVEQKVKIYQTDLIKTC